jgi:hypothetical protein
MLSGEKKNPAQTGQKLRGTSAGTGIGFECRNYSDSRLISGCQQPSAVLRSDCNTGSRGSESEVFLLSKCFDVSQTKSAAGALY